MKIALLPPTSDEVLSPVENYFLTHAVGTLLAGHELRWIRPEEHAENALFAELNRFDAVVFLGNSMFSSGNRHGFQWKADHIRLLKPQVIALALGMPAREAHDWDEADSDDLIRALHRRGRLSVADKVTRDRVAELVGKENVRLVGCPALWMETGALRYREGRRVFLPAIHDPAFAGRDGGLLPRLIREYYQRLQHLGRVLFTVEHPREFELGARPGLTTLYSPRFPEMHLKAIASGSAVIGFKPLPLLAAVANGVPAILVGNDPWAKSMAETAGIPFLEINANTDPADLSHRTDEQLRKYPWESVREKLAALRSGMTDFLKDRGLSTSATRRPKTERKGPSLVTEGGPVLHVCSIADSNYLPFFLGLVQNVQDIHAGNVRLHLLALDDKAPALARQAGEDLPITFHSLSDLWSEAERAIVLGRNPGGRAFSSKAKLIARVLRQTGQPVLYADADVFFFESPAAIFDAIPEKSSVLLFPHLSDSYRAGRRDGLFNAGMIAVRPGAEAFLDWWAKLCLDQCALRHETGHVADQGYLDFAPVLFPEVAIYRDGDHDVARWNLHTLGLRYSAEASGAPVRADGRRVKSFHAAVCDEAGFHESKFVWDQLACFFSGLTHVDRSEPLASNLLLQQRGHWQALGRFLNANRMLGTHFWPAAHRPTLSELRFFVSGPGRFLVRACARVRRPGDVPPPPIGTEPVFDLDPSERTWVRLQQEVVLRRQAPSSPAPSASPAATPTDVNEPAARALGAAAGEN